MDRSNGRASVVALYCIAVILLVTTVIYARNSTLSNFLLRSGRSTGIKVYGHSKMMVSPDIATVSLGIVTREKTSKQAAEKNALVAQRVLSAVKNIGVSSDDIRTTGYSVEPWMEYSDSGSRQLGYEVSNTMRVTVRDLGKISDVLDAGIRAGANSVQGVSFGLADEEGLRAKALALAVKNARRKADSIARTLGKEVGEPLSVSENGDSELAYQPALMPSLALHSRQAKTPISPGEQKFTYDVEVTFSIR